MAKYDIKWSQLKKTIKNDVVPHVNNLKTHTNNLDEHLKELYKVFQTKSSLKFYKSYAGHINLNYKWVKKFEKYNTAIENIRVISR